jgi:hypothetical protein
MELERYYTAIYTRRMCKKEPGNFLNDVFRVELGKWEAFLILTLTLVTQFSKFQGSKDDFDQI